MVVRPVVKECPALGSSCLAAHDVAARRGWCRSGFPRSFGTWPEHTHDWDEAALALIV